MNEQCNNCQRRHKASEEGFCEEFTFMPQISICRAFLAEKPNPAEPVVPANIPTGEYIHIQDVSNSDIAQKRT
jgi:hypothetical protein